jgi:hypothetical protein
MGKEKVRLRLHVNLKFWNYWYELKSRQQICRSAGSYIELVSSAFTNSALPRKPPYSFCQSLHT